MTTLLESLPAVSLPRLVEEAALLRRLDRTYVVPAASLPELVRSFAARDPGLSVLEISGRREHRYSSTYLDTDGLASYLGAARGRRRRFKVRSRHYLDTGASFAEVKTRGPRGITVKARRPRSGPHVEEHRFVAAQLRGAGVPSVDVSELRPTLTSAYTRVTLWLPHSGSRVTLDSDLVWSLPEGSTAAVPGVAVVETKSPPGAGGVDRALWSRHLRPVRLSKYGAGLALLHPELPAHRWHRVLDRHLAPAAQFRTAAPPTHEETPCTPTEAPAAG